MCSIENLELAYSKARRGKTLKDYVIDFQKNLKQNLLELRNGLLLQTYKPRPLKTFILRDPKTRKISKSDFRDRIIHHAICNLIEPVFDKTFIHDSFANRPRKGTINAIKRFDHYKRKVSKNNTIKCFVLKADIKSYFDTVDHGTLLCMLDEKIKDKRIIWLITQILNNNQGKQVGRGMPLGNLTSQFFANVYLNELDQYVKHVLKAKHYIRYVDDFVILHRSSKILQKYKDEIDVFLKEKLMLKLHPEKSQILKLDKGINFLGFRLFYHHKLLARKNMRKFEKRMEQLKNQYKSEKINRENVIEKFEGWLAYSNHANMHKYRRKITSKFNQAFPTTTDITINSVKKHENFNRKIEKSKTEYTQQKTLYLLKKGLNIKPIAQHRKVKEGTIWRHISQLVEHNQLMLKTILPTWKIGKILKHIKSPQDKLTDIKNRLNDESISFNEIECVLANVKGKHKKKSILYWVSWYQKTNCYRKCYYNEKQRQTCRMKFQQLAAKTSELHFTKNEYLDFFNNHTNICALPDKDKRKHLTWREFKKRKTKT